MSKDYVKKYYGQLVGKTVKRIVNDTIVGDPVTGLQFTDGTMAWVLQDPEGNGPGFLDIYKEGEE